MPRQAEISEYHRKHRLRLRQRFDKSGFEGFHDYEVLELLLTYVIPVKDTKPTAKELLRKFKHLPGVLSADVKELTQVKGIGPEASLFLKIVDAFIGFYFDQKALGGDIQFKQLSQLVDYFRATIGRNPNEMMRVLYLNSQNKLIVAENLSEGTVSQAVAFPRRIVEAALKHHATTIIIAHNHPGGLPEPSENDNAITQQIKNALHTVNITLQEHIITAEDSFYSYRQSGSLD
jgi:DNA repair protein RadC